MKSLSRNLLKGGYVIVSEKERITIDRNETVAKRLEELSQLQQEESIEEEETENFVEGIDPTMVAKLVEEQSDMDALTEERERIFARAEEKAEEEAKKIVQEATEESKRIFEEAKNNGYQEGYQNGSMQAQADMENKYQERCALLEQEKLAMEADYNNKLSAMEPELVDKLMDIFRHVTGVRLEDDRAAILFILQRAMQSLENGRNYIIHVSKEDYGNVKEHLDDIVQGTGLLKETFEIVEDITLGLNSCMIESEAGIWDCGLGTQMKLLQKQLRILSYEPE
ncbi:MAG TPA: FliH/SctL family protein [Lachnospiraceae bacterium]|nr:FliH/SctL family protein [Lachnospiraceae bacterium]